MKFEYDSGKETIKVNGIEISLHLLESLTTKNDRWFRIIEGCPNEWGSALLTTEYRNET